MREGGLGWRREGGGGSLESLGNSLQAALAILCILRLEGGRYLATKYRSVHNT